MSTSDEPTRDEGPADREPGREDRPAQDESGVEVHPPSSANELWDHNAYGREHGDVGGDATSGPTATRDPRGGAPAYNIDAGDDDAAHHGDDSGRDDRSNVRETGESLTGADATAGEDRESVGDGGEDPEPGRGARGAADDEGRAGAAPRGTTVRREGHGDVAGDDVAGGRRPADGGEDACVVRHEERLRVGTERVETGRTRLRKYVAEEPVRAEQSFASEDVEEVRTPVTEEEREAYLAGRELTVGEDEVVLYREVPVVRTVRVPYERVRLVVRRTERTEVIEDTVRKERIDVEEE